MARLAAGSPAYFLTTFHLALRHPSSSRPYEHTNVAACLGSGDLRPRQPRRPVIDPEVARWPAGHTARAIGPVEEIVDYVMGLLNRHYDFKPKVLVTAGPTVRISILSGHTNRSSGRWLWRSPRPQETAERCGPGIRSKELEFPPRSRTTTEEMRRAVIETRPMRTVVIKAAAAAGFPS